LQDQAGAARVWPVIKADAYGHGAEPIARHLVDIGYRTLCVATVVEALALVEAGIDAVYVILSATLPEHSEALVTNGRFEPVVCTSEMLEALAGAACKTRRTIAVHVKVDTGMGRIGIRPDELHGFLDHARKFPQLHVRGIMSHFPRADEVDKVYSREQCEKFSRLVHATRAENIDVYHMANSAALLDVPESCFDAVRPGIGMYGLRPSAHIVNPRVNDLLPVLEWKTRITFLKQVAAGTGLSYGHSYHTQAPSLIATVPAGYADGLGRRLSHRAELLVRGMRCPLVGRITMDMSMIDVTALGGLAAIGDEAVIIGRQGKEEITADELAMQLSTINYEIVTRIGPRVPRIVVAETGKSE
jgi:alanine racemase